jgi:hypothetical protein
MGSQGFDQFRDLSFKNIFQFIERQSDTMVCNPSLGKIVGTDSSASVSGADLAFSFF